MVIVRARFPQHWRNNKYDKDEKMPANEEQARRLTQANVAYYDFEEDEETEELMDSLQKPTMDNTKKEIEAYLEEQAIEYDEYATKSELLELVD